MATQSQYETLAKELITKKTATYLPILMIDGVRVHCYLKLECSVSPEQLTRLTLNVCNPTYRFYDEMGQYNPLHNLITFHSTLHSTNPEIVYEWQIVDLIKDIVIHTGELKYDKMRGFKPETGNLDYIMKNVVFAMYEPATRQRVDTICAYSVGRSCISLRAKRTTTMMTG